MRSLRATRLVSVRATLAALLAVGLLTSCGGDNTTAPVVQPPETVARIEVAASTNTISTAQTLLLTAIARTTSGNVLAFAPTWSSSAPSVATVNASTGLVAGVAAGTATITASSGAVSGTAIITVTAVAGSLSSVAVSTTDSTIQLAQQTQIRVVGRDPGGATIALGTRPVTWTSSNSTIVTVTLTGAVTGVGIGSATITVSVAEGTVARTASVPITVTSIPGAPNSADVFMPGLTFSAFQTIVRVGGTVRFVFPALAHNVFWDPRVGTPSDIATTSDVTVERVFAASGLFHYKCTLHNGMEGDIVVTP